jgi:hypothetical protein
MKPTMAVNTFPTSPSGAGLVVTDIDVERFSDFYTSYNAKVSSMAACSL